MSWLDAPQVDGRLWRWCRLQAPSLSSDVLRPPGLHFLPSQHHWQHWQLLAWQPHRVEHLNLWAAFLQRDLHHMPWSPWGAVASNLRRQHYVPLTNDWSHWPWPGHAFPQSSLPNCEAFWCALWWYTAATTTVRRWWLCALSITLSRSSISSPTRILFTWCREERRSWWGFNTCWICPVLCVVGLMMYLFCVVSTSPLLSSVLSRTSS